MAALVEGMRRTGVRIAIDDFGAGHSTPERVRSLRPDIVKIDAGWFQKVVAEETATALLPGLFSHLHLLGCRVLVEGIETADQLAAAIEAGADYFQGFLIARPALAGTIFDETPVPIERFLPAAPGQLRSEAR